MHNIRILITQLKLKIGGQKETFSKIDLEWPQLRWLSSLSWGLTFQQSSLGFFS